MEAEAVASGGGVRYAHRPPVIEVQPPPGVSATIEYIMGVWECVMGNGLTCLKGFEGVMFKV